MRLIVLLFAVLMPLSSFAWGSYLYQDNFYTAGKNYLSLLQRTADDRVENLAPEQQRICKNLYGTLLQDGVLDIRIALGYFDWTTGSPIVMGRENYGYSPSIDPGAFKALRDLLVSSCKGNNKLCGFRQDRESPYLFSRPITVQGRTFTARVEVHFSSAGELLSRNTGRDADEQAERSQYADKFFQNALRNADVTFYFGHSRNGGGPDFYPPRLLAGRNKVDYSYYKSERPGMKKMLNAFSSSPKPSRIFGLFSCDSRDHFLRKVREISPNTGVITSLDVLTVNEVWTGMLGTMDSMLRGQCQKSFYQSLRMTSRNERFMTMDGVFN